MSGPFHNTSSNQQATNQQVGVNSSGSSGSSIVLGAGAISGTGNTFSVQSVDPAALAVAGNAVTGAINSNSIATQGALQAFQGALTVAGQQAQSATQLASSGAGSGANVTGNDTAGSSFVNQLGITPSHIIWVGIAIVAVMLFMGLRKGYRR